jgi:hypothetical protein
LNEARELENRRKEEEMQIALETWESISEKDFNKLFKEFQVIKLKINQY